MAVSKQLDAHKELIEQEITKSFVANDVTQPNTAVSAGLHLIADFYNAKPLNDINVMEQALTEAARVAGATLLHIHLHTFSDGGGITGVALLAESHISVHTWPELEYAAFDVFMCGDAEPEKAIALLQSTFTPQRVELKSITRG